jgi:hypothetical protein
VARDYKYTETGVGLLAEDDGNFQDLVEKRCKYFYDLETIFSDLVGVSPEINEDTQNDGFGGNYFDDSDEDSSLGDVITEAENCADAGGALTNLRGDDSSNTHSK